jgi:transcriptional regulator with XRE-family HTH domain
MRREIDRHKMGERIRLLRASRGMSQKVLGKKIGVSGQTVSAYENGKCCPLPDKITALSVVFNQSVFYVLGQTDLMRLPDCIKL